MAISFGNEFIDYAASDFDHLVEIAESSFDDRILEHMNDHTRVFVLFWRLLNSRKGQAIPISEFLGLDIDFQKICLLVFLISIKRGNTSIKTNLLTVTYFGL